jgi:lipopolysaccharide transport system permease protein
MTSSTLSDAPAVRGMSDHNSSTTQVLELTSAPATRRQLLSDIADHREVLGALARKDFQTRYKRATLGILWAVAVPVLQAAVMAVVFSKLIRFDTAGGYAPFVMSGVVMWTFFAATLTVASTAVVDNASLTEKVWFPRAVLPIVPALSNLVGFLISYTVVVLLLPAFDVDIRARLLVSIPAIALLLAFTIALSLVLAAMHVYFRDVRYIVQAALLVWMYVTPVIYPQSLLGRWSWLLDFNPLTGIVDLFRLATIGTAPDWGRPVIVSVVATLVLAVVALETHRRHDRLFADQL